MDTKSQGQAVPVQIRKVIISLWNDGNSMNAIAKRLCLSRKAISNIVNRFVNENCLAPKTGGSNIRTATTDTNITYIQYCKDQRASIFAKEIQQEMINNQVCLAETVPSRASISRALNGDLGYSYKRLHKIARESITPENDEKLVEYLATCVDTDPRTMHFFDEASVVKTTGNRNYGHSAIGSEAVEIQRYASNATFTINLLHSIVGIQHVNILSGASNGIELLNFFAEALNETDAFGNSVLKRGDIVIMDNCGFHHGAMTEPVLRRMLADHGVDLIYQPPYHPVYNTCEMCFAFMKRWLREHSGYTEKYTEIAILDALSYVAQDMSRNFFRKCGYVD